VSYPLEEFLRDLKDAADRDLYFEIPPEAAGAAYAAIRAALPTWISFSERRPRAEQARVLVWDEQLKFVSTLTLRWCDQSPELLAELKYTHWMPEPASPHASVPVKQPVKLYEESGGASICGKDGCLEPKGHAGPCCDIPF
jgi:hypothetical protein